ncbi:MAG: lysylphosphatidylglycerol synthase transmembrane domain-containing protein [Phycisphaerae bacterium]
MTKTKRKILFTVLKVLVAVVLIGWVVSKASWNDYVHAVSGGKEKEYSLVDPRQLRSDPLPARIDATEGMLFWKKAVQVESAALVPLTDSAGRPVRGPDGRFVYERPGMAGALKNLDWGLLAAAIGGLLAALLIMAVRYWFLLRIQDVRIRLWESVRLTYLGAFFNYFMPGSVGGDLVKAYYVAKHTERKAAVWVTTFVDRLLGVTELVLLGGVMIVVALAQGASLQERSMKWSVFILLVAIAAIVLAMTFVLSSRFRRLFHLQKIYQRMSFAHHLAAAGDAARLYRQRIGAMVKAIGITVGAQVISIASVMLIGLSLHMAVPVVKYFIYIPMIWMLGAIPLTPGGVGWIESLYGEFFAGPGVVFSTILVLALLARFVQMATALPGVIVYFAGPRLPKAEAMEAELEGDQAHGQGGNTDSSGSQSV